MVLVFEGLEPFASSSHLFTFILCAMSPLDHVLGKSGRVSPSREEHSLQNEGDQVR